MLSPKPSGAFFREAVSFAPQPGRRLWGFGVCRCRSGRDGSSAKRRSIERVLLGVSRSRKTLVRGLLYVTEGGGVQIARMTFLRTYAITAELHCNERWKMTAICSPTLLLPGDVPPAAALGCQSVSKHLGFATPPPYSP